jgi:hypothetical protein
MDLYACEQMTGLNKKQRCVYQKQQLSIKQTSFATTTNNQKQKQSHESQKIQLNPYMKDTAFATPSACSAASQVSLFLHR